MSSNSIIEDTNHKMQQMDREEQIDSGIGIVATIDSNAVVSQRMTIAGGFLDVALFVADVEHLKFVIETGKDSVRYYTLLMTLLLLSLILQIVVGILLFVMGIRKVSEQTETQAKWTKVLNHTIVGLVFMIALTNILITSFGDRGETLSNYISNHNCS
ncbi:unnamed protein product [Medioppia subpectinata]|uniref:Uncharacterized protein n=1 Tax=Medioppia subpectinata TaxID=1979941 RepID=A0A7R9L6X4_9ACAR|nr:unnamed protein product [Medioppia subpectinata]CAG2116535.1 unnamed protein product [Medioppia subpectinata]